MRYKLILVNTLLAILILSGPGYSEKEDPNPEAPSPTDRPAIQAETNDLPLDEVIYEIISPDGKHIARVGRKGSRQLVVRNGVGDQPYDEICQLNQAGINFGMPRFSADSSRLIYIARRGSDYFVVVDGIEQGPYSQSAITSLVMSEEGNHYAYAIQQFFSSYAVQQLFEGKKQIEEKEDYAMVVHDGKPSVRFWHLEKPIVLSPDGTRIAYRVQGRESKSRREYWRMVVDGNAGPKFTPSSHPVQMAFSADSKHFFYAHNTDQSGTSVIVVDGKPRGSYTKILYPQISRDGSHLAFVDRRAILAYVPVIDGKEGAPVREISEFLMNPATGRVAFVEKTEARRIYVNVDGTRSLEYDEFKKLLFSPKGDHVALVVAKGNKDFVVLDGRESSAFESVDVNSLHFNPDGSSFSYMAKPSGSGMTLFSNGKPQPTMEELQRKKAEDEKATREQAEVAAKAKEAKANEAKALEEAAKARAFQVLFQFDGSQVPGATIVLVGKDGTVYVACKAGRWESATLLRIDKHRAKVDAPVVFDDPLMAGAMINSLLLADDGTVYGSTTSSAKLGGCLFRYRPGEQKGEYLYVSQPVTDTSLKREGWMDVLQSPLVSYISPDGELYGLCDAGLGTALFRYSTRTGSLEIIHNGGEKAKETNRSGNNTLWRYVRNTDPRKGAYLDNPNAGQKFGNYLVAVGDRLFSCLREGGRANSGVIVSLNRDGSDFRQVFEFSPRGPEGYHPGRIRLGPDGFLYLSTYSGGATANGALVRMDPEGRDCKPLVNWDGQRRGSDHLAFDANGTLYFATSHYPSIRRVKIDGSGLEIVRDFDYHSNIDSLVLGSDNSLYGTLNQIRGTTFGSVFSQQLN